jgi:CRP/FNR family transcriptional regulator
MIACDTCAVRNRAICSALNPAELTALNAIGRRRTIEAGETLIWEGDESIVVANVIDGILKLSTGTEDGREQIVGVVYPADFVGSPFGPTTRHSVTALTDVRVCSFARADFERFAGAHPSLGHKLLQRTLAELDRTRAWMLLLARKSAEQKIATFLLDMAKRLGEAGEETDQPLGCFDLPFSRQQIGDVLGLTIETVSRQMTKLKRDAVIDLPGRRAVRIVDHAALEAIAG